MKQIDETEFMRFLWERGHRELIVLIKLGHSEIFTDELLNEFEEWKKGKSDDR